MPYDISAARQAGISDEEIADVLAPKMNYDLDGARKAGISNAEIADALSSKFNKFPTLSERANAGVGGINRGIASIVGMPVDTAENVFNLGKAGVGSILTALGHPEMAPELTRGSFGGSEYISSALNKIGVNTDNPNPQDVPSQMLFRAGTIAPSAAFPGASVRNTLASAGGAAIGEQVGGAPGAAIGSMVAPIVGSASYRGAVANRPQRSTSQIRTEAQARAEGYKFPPSETNPTIANRVLEGWAGKLTTRQMASSGNAEVTTRIAKRSLGIPDNRDITEGTLVQIRNNAGQTYESIKTFGASNNLRFRTDATFNRDVNRLGGDYKAAVREFPELARNPQIETLQQSLRVPNVTPTASIELIKKLRFDSSANFKAREDPARLALAQAQRDGANALENLVDRRLIQSGQPELVQNFRNARTIIARTYDVEAALNNATGHVNPKVLSSMQDKGKRLGGGLEVAANTYKAFPRDMQTPEMIGSQPGISPLDVAGSAFIGGSRRPELVGALMARPFVRSGIMSNQYQRAFGTQASILEPEPDFINLLRSNLSIQK